MIHIPSPTTLREDAREEAEIRVSALLQTFAMPGITQEQIRTLLVDTIANTHVGSFARGWDAALEASGEAIGQVERFRPPQR